MNMRVQKVCGFNRVNKTGNGTVLRDLLTGVSAAAMIISSSALAYADDLLLYDQDEPLTVGTSITGATSVVQAGAGTLTLTGMNTYTGTTTINDASTLALSGQGRINTSSQVIVNGTLDVSAAASAKVVTLAGSGEVVLGSQSLSITQGSDTFSGVITGTGGLGVQGGTQILIGENTFEGGVGLNQGATLQIGDGGSTGSIVADVTNYGTLAFNRDDTVVYAGTITGPGTLSQMGSGTLVLTGANSGANNVVIAAGGALQLGEGGTTGWAGGVGQNQGTIANDGLLIYNRAGVVSFQGSISGTGVVRQSGDTLELSGNNSYSGGTEIAAGTLRLQSNNAAGTGVISMADGTVLGLVDGLVVENAINLGSGSTTIAVQSGIAELSGGLAGNGAVAVKGGLLRLTAANAGLSGTLALESASIALEDDNAAGTAHIQASGASGIVYGDGVEIDNEVTIADGHTLNLDVAADEAATQSGIIDGNGRIHKTGTGELILAADNSYSGGTVISEGTLVVGAGGDQGWIVGDVASSGSLIFDRSDVVTFAGNIIGSGEVEQRGSGTLILTADNNYSGGTKITSGVMQIGNGGTTGSIVGPIDNSGKLVFDRSNTLIVRGEIAGTGGVTQAGSGTVILLADNGYSGGTTISSGTLQLGFSGETGSIQGDVVNNGELIFSRSNAVNFEDVISGSGKLQMNGGGKLSLSGINTYSGTTTIAQGSSLALSGDGSIANSSDVAVGGIFDISDATGPATIKSLSGAGLVALGSQKLTLTEANGSFAGVISGAGSFHISAGQQVLTGASTYTGGTNIASGGELILGNGGTAGSITGDVTNDGILRFNRSNDAIFAGVISGTGSITKSGSGALTLSGDNSAYAGTTEVAAGTLIVSDSLGGSIQILSGGALSGNGSVGATSIGTGGTLTPGGAGAIATMNVGGNLEIASDASYVVNTDAAGNSDFVHVSGQASLGGGSVVSIAANGNWLVSTNYTILTADDGILGVFADEAVSNFAFLTPTLSYDPNNVYLKLLRNDVSFGSVGATSNQRATGNAIDSLEGGALANALVVLSEEGAQNALDQLSGEVHASVTTGLLEDSRFVREATGRQLRGVSGNEASFWTQGYGSWGTVDGTAEVSGFDRNTGGIFIGADAPVFDNFRLGIVGGYGHSSLRLEDGKGSASIDSYSLGVYGGGEWNNLGLRLGVDNAWHSVSTNRSVGFTGFDDALKADYHARTTQAYGDIGYKFDVGSFDLEPFAGLAYVNVDAGHYGETGGSAALSGSGADADATFTTLGLRASSTFLLGDAIVTANGMLGWRHSFDEVNPTATHAFAASNAFTVSGTPLSRDVAVIEAGLSAALSANVSLGVTYSGQFGSGISEQGVRGNLNWKF
ncbi:autotransporter domain-containing protein [Shinella sp. PSBB067]|uniref:autotransporter domain-containing protein n=1 Tax=Shinella sp. PSBB067 TaxID=2715959 RepID=UPI00193BC60E|nr:autotransporter domain-containing protein [Shinella sp. PSBB067]QRI63769.1 autotransporter domain-containing protein [Shinella sp. PSBB067]